MSNIPATGHNKHTLTIIMYSHVSFLLTLLIISVKGDFQADCQALNAGTIKSIYMYGSCYVVDTSKTSSADSAPAQCTHMTGGHLALAHVMTLTKKLTEFLTTIGVQDTWMALRQYDKLSEPAGHWEWVLDSGSVRSDLILWLGGDPNNHANTEDCAFLRSTTGGHHDALCTDPYNFMCQYSNPVQNPCYTEYKNAKFNSLTQISDEGLLGEESVAKDECAKKCAAHRLCFGFMVKPDDGRCWLHQDDGLWKGKEPVADSNYNIYVMK